MGSCTKRQKELCDLLIDNGAPHELKLPHEDSFEAADAFIKKNYSYLQQGIVKHPNYGRGLDAAMYNIPNM